MRTIKRRRKENKTDYKIRMKLLKSGKPRLVVRKTNRYIICQYVISDESKDKVVFGLTSKELLRNGLDKKFAGSLKSIPASYLTGYLAGKKILEKKLETPIIDFGMQRVIHKTRLFGFLKGLVDAGVEISSPKEAFPDEKRIKTDKFDVDAIKKKLEAKK